MKTMKTMKKILNRILAAGLLSVGVMGIVTSCENIGYDLGNPYRCRILFI